ncbi:MAG: methylated-DNA--[protein]-cysteine S-methyltransferase [Eubacteriales bacterium]
MYFTYFPSPVGLLRLEGTATCLTSLTVCREQGPKPDSSASCPLLDRAVGELEAYFSGTRRVFDIPLDPAGTDFQKRVWAAVSRIPYGRTLTYGQVATDLGAPGACRAVGMAAGRNPILILVPCHRVIGADGSLTGYAGGLEMKRALLALEAGHPL